jgi:hypothetical protein
MNRFQGLPKGQLSTIDGMIAEMPNGVMADVTIADIISNNGPINDAVPVTLITDAQANAQAEAHAAVQDAAQAFNPGSGKFAEISGEDLALLIDGLAEDTAAPLALRDLMRFRDKLKT